MSAEQTPQQEKKGSIADLIGDLNFVPAWARDEAVRTEPRGERAEITSEEKVREKRAGRRSGLAPSRDRRGDAGRRKDTVARGHVAVRETKPDLSTLPVRVRFIPDRKALGMVARDLHVSRRAMPLQRLAAALLTGKDSCLVIIERVAAATDDTESAVRLYECRVCKQVFREYAGAFAHVVGAHLDLHFRCEVREGEPPSGQFASIGRCRLSGELLGPPNHHEYNDRLMDLYRRRFSHLSLDEYRQQIEMVRDPALIEQWRQEARKQNVFFSKDEKHGNTEMGRREAERIFAEKYAKNLIRETRRVLIPRQVAMALEDSVLAEAVRLYADREVDKPYSMMAALRAAFHKMRFHTFHARGTVFVTCVEPRPLDPSHAVAEVAELLEFLRQHPGLTRRDVVAQLRPGARLDAPETVALLRHLSWLIEKGHVIEFFDGALAVPQSLQTAPVRGRQTSARIRDMGGAM